MNEILLSFIIGFVIVAIVSFICFILEKYELDWLIFFILLLILLLMLFVSLCCLIGQGALMLLGVIR